MRSAIFLRNPLDYNSARQVLQILTLSFYHFSRPYCDNHSYFLFLRLLICLSSAGNLAWFLVLNEEVLIWFRASVIQANRLKPEASYDHALCPTSSLCEKETASLGWSSQPADRVGAWLALIFNERNVLYEHVSSHLVVLIQRTHRNKHTERSTSQCQLRSKTCWLSEFCYSQWISLFAAFFIVMGA